MTAGMKVVLVLGFALLALVGGYFLLVPPSPPETPGLREVQRGKPTTPLAQHQQTEIGSAPSGTDVDQDEMQRSIADRSSPGGNDVRVGDDAARQSLPTNNGRASDGRLADGRNSSMSHDRNELAPLSADAVLSDPTIGDGLRPLVGDADVRADGGTTAPRLADFDAPLAQDAPLMSRVDENENHATRGFGGANVSQTRDSTSTRNASPERTNDSPSGNERESLLSPAERETADFRSYTIKEGDTLSGIAGWWFGDVSAWQRIVDTNPGLAPTTLQIGQVIHLPAGTRDASSSTPAQPVETQNVYTVKAGDSLSQIARQVYGKAARWIDIYEANRDVLEGGPDSLSVGMKLRLPPK